MQSLLNIKKVALIFFVVTGIAHLGSSILIANQIFLAQSTIVNRVMDIPFIVTGMIYGFASLRLALTDPDQKHKYLDIFLISLIILVLLGLILINIFLPDL